MQPVVGHFGSRLTRNEVMKSTQGGGDTEPRRVGWGNCLRSKVLTITMSGVLFCPPAFLCLSSLPLLSLSFPHFPPISLSLSHYPPVTLFDLEIPTVCGEKGDNWEGGKGGERERGGEWRKGGKGRQMRGGQQQVVVMETGRIVTRLTSTGECWWGGRGVVEAGGGRESVNE